MKTAFIFSGQGAQFVGMGKDLYDASAAARAVYQEADSILSWPVSDVSFNGPEEKLTSSIYCQPAIYTCSCACLAAFRERFPGIAPAALAGLSLGEYAALTAADCFSFADGLRLVAKRGELMDLACKESDGGMASVLGGDPAVIAEVAAECGIDVANYNCPGQIVISGLKPGVEKAAALLKEKGAKRVIPLKVAGAFHSRLMAKAGEGLASVLAEIPVRGPRVATAQNFTGKLVENESEIKENLVHQVAGSVRWDSCVKAMVEGAGVDTLIEFGPGAVLSGLVKKIDAGKTVFNVSSLADLDKLSF